MRKRSFKRLALWINGIIASLFVIPGITTICTDINGDVKSFMAARAEDEVFYYAEFSDKIFAYPNNSSDIVYATIKARSHEACTITVEYETHSVNAIEGVDYVGSSGAEEFTFDAGYTQTRTIAFKSLLTAETKEKVSTVNHRLRWDSSPAEAEDGGFYGRHFKVKITHITVVEDGTTTHIYPESDPKPASDPSSYRNSQYTTCVYLPYQYRTNVFFDYKNSKQFGAEKNDGFYEVIYNTLTPWGNTFSGDAICDGTRGLDGKKNWYNWEKSFYEGITASLNSNAIDLVDAKILKAYGTVMSRSIDTAGWHSNSKIHFSWGNEGFFRDYYQKFGETKSNDFNHNYPNLNKYLGMHIRVDPEATGGYRLNGTAVNYLSEGKNPNGKEDKLINVPNGPTWQNADRRKITFRLGRSCIDYLGKEGDLYNTTFYRMYPYCGSLSIGIAIYNSNKEYDIEARDIYSHIVLVDDTAPYIKDEYAEYDKEGNIKIYLRFSEAVFPKKEKPFMVKVNNISYVANYVGGYFSDTLVYEIPAEKLQSNHQKIKKITYTLPENDISDLGMTYDAYGNYKGNMLIEDGAERTVKIIGDVIDLSIPHLGVDIDRSDAYKNAYDIILSANSTTASKDFTEGTVYYTWDQRPNWEATSEEPALDPYVPANYDYTHVLTDEEKGSFQVTLVNVPTGTYYLHALAVPTNGGRNPVSDARTFGPYKYDNTGFPASFAVGNDPGASTQVPSNLKTKYFNLTIGQKGTDSSQFSALDTVDLVYDIKDDYGNVTPISKRIIEGGAILPSLSNVVKQYSSSSGTIYTYYSNIDSKSTISVDKTIQEYLTDDVFRLDTKIHFIVTDKAGNSTVTNSVDVSYDVRGTFKGKVTFPSDYTKQPRFSGINYDVYVYDTQQSIRFEVDPTDTVTLGYIQNGAVYSLSVNGQVYEASSKTSYISLPLSSGMYVISPRVSGGTDNVNLVGENITFCLTHGLDDMTTNRTKTTEDLVLNNSTYQLNDAKFYYYVEGTSKVSSINYGATINPDSGKYEGGSTEPTFSSIAAAKKYIKFMEKQDLYLIQLTETTASLLNTGQGSTAYVMAEDETLGSARAGQLWIRYKKKTWTNGDSNPFSWAFYFYSDSGDVSDGINPYGLSKNLNDALDIVTNRIVNNGSTRYLVDEETLSPTTSAPYLRPSQLHAYPETVYQTMCGTKYAGTNSSYTSEGDMSIYQNTVNVLGIAYPLATNMELSISDMTTLYYYYQGSSSSNWNKIDARDGDILGKVLGGDRGVYTIKEYDENGVSTFDVYIDHVQPIITAYIDEDFDTPYILPDSSGVTKFNGKSFTLSSLTDTDQLAYIAVFTYPQRVLENVYYASDFSGNQSYTLRDGNHYVQVGDRSGNVTTYTVILSQTLLEVTAEETSSKNGVRVKVNNRDEKEIYSYLIYINGELKYSTYVQDKVYTETGIYRIIVSDIYGNSVTKAIVHEAPAPEVTWYYYVGDTPVQYDPEHESRMVINTDATNPRLSYIYSSACARAIFDAAGVADDISFEVIGLDNTEYSYSPTRKALVFNTLKNWRLRVWYSKTPESDRVFIFEADSRAPVYSGTFVGSSYAPVVVYDGDKVVSTSTFDVIDWSKYPNIDDVITLDYLDYQQTGTTLLPFDSGDTISGTQITIRINDNSGVSNVSLTKDGVVVTNPKYDSSTGVLTLTGYGEYVVTATDALGNISNFSFSNIEYGLAGGYIDESTTPIEESKVSYGHDNFVVRTYSVGTQLILIKYGDLSYTYELHFDGDVLTYGRYIKRVEVVDNIESPYSYYDEVSGFSLVVDSVSKNQWYKVIETTRYVVEAMFDNNRNVSYRISTPDNDLYVETLFSVGKGRLPSLYKASLSKKESKLTIYSGDQEIVEGSSFYINVSKTLTIDTDDYDTDITEVKYSFSPIGIVKDYTVIFDGETWSPFIGEEKGYYQIIVTNKFGNVKTYNLKKIDTFGFYIKIHTMDNSDVYYEDQRHVAYSNQTISLIVLSDAVTFYVNGIRAAAEYEHDAMVLTLTVEGQFHVEVISDNGIKEEFDFEIFDDNKFIFQEEWITGYSEKALVKDYTNTPCTIHVGEGVDYIDVSINGTLHKLYDAINANPDIETESLINAIGRYGNGEYKVGFRNKYGDLQIKSVFYSNTPSLTLERKTTNDPNTFTSYDIYTALNRGFYSNYVLRFSTTSKNYIFTINGAEYKLDEPYSIEFSNISGTGSFSYTIGFNDEYGNDVTFNAILYREDISADLSNMKIVTVGNEYYTKDDIAVVFADNLNGIVSINDGDYSRYISGYKYYADGKYTFVINDIAGNRFVYTINHKSMNHYSLVDTKNNNAEVITDGVVNYSSVLFSSTDESYIKHVFKDGELLSEYQSNTFNSTGHWELLIEDAIGNQSYESFYILNNELAKFVYNTPYDYEITEVWKVESEDSRKLLPITGVTTLTLDENGSYAIVVTSTKTISSFNFTVAINDAPPTAKLVGAEDGGVTARDVQLSGLVAGDIVKVYKNGVLVETTTVTAAKNSPTITTSGKYRIEITNIQGVTTAYEFTRKPIASASASIFIVITCVIAMAGLAFGLVYHTKLKTDE